MLHNVVQGGNSKMDIVPVQQQQNGFDCRVYAITFIIFLVNKKDLLSIFFL